jgi:hypothetical protein
MDGLSGPKIVYCCIVLVLSCEIRSIAVILIASGVPLPLK